MKRLTAKRIKFIREYQKDFNATKAAERAGYSKSTAYQIGHNLLKQVDVAREIEERARQAADDAQVTVDWIVKQLKVLHATAKNENVKLGAIEFLGKWQGMLKDKGDAPQVVIIGADDFDKEPGAGVSDGG